MLDTVEHGRRWSFSHALEGHYGAAMSGRVFPKEGAGIGYQSAEGGEGEVERGKACGVMGI